MITHEDGHSARDPSTHSGKKRKSLPYLLMGALGAGLLTGGILAYQTNSDMTGNIFTTGNVRITSWEPGFPTEDKDKGSGEKGKDGVPDDCELVIPFETISKDPRIKNTGTNDCVVFFRVTAPVEDLTLIHDDGTRTEAEPCDLFWFKQADDSDGSHENNFNANWQELTAIDGQFVHCDGINEEGRGKVYIFGYKTRLASNEVTSTLFDKVQNKKYGSRTISANEVEQIRIESFAVQADEVLRLGSEVPTDGEISEEDLTYIYEVFINQNAETVGTLTEGGVRYEPAK